MKPFIQNTSFGSIQIDKEKYKHDIYIKLSGEIKKRNKKLSKAIFGTSHVISLDEAKHVYEEGSKLMIIGTGQYDKVRLSEEAQDFFYKKRCDVILESTSKAIKTWNSSKQESLIGLFHLTC